jgi:hypothetical protein
MYGSKPKKRVIKKWTGPSRRAGTPQLTMAQSDIRAAQATLQARNALRGLKPFAECTLEEQLRHPVLQLYVN